MPTISGSVLFNVTNTAPTTGTATPNIPIVLRNSTTGVGLAIKTDASGAYSFTNVPNGTYTLVESWVTTATLVSPADFGVLATTIPAPTPQDPPITNVPSPPATANEVQSLTQNTINLNVTGNIPNLNFVDGPVANIPLAALDTTFIGPNLISVADLGTFGTLPAGTAAGNTPDPPGPYPDIAPGFTYVKSTNVAPGDGSYSIININNLTIFSAWFNTADHTSRDETGRLQLVNGANPGAIVFQDTIVNVNPNTYYAAGVWIMNLYFTGQLPAVGVRVKTVSGTTIFDQPLSNIGTTAIPTWRQSQTLFNSGNNSTIQMQIYSNGPAGNGNDYALDDVFIYEAQLDEVIQSTKSVSKAYADIGDTLTYTVVLKNTGQSTATSIIFDDTIPNGVTFKTGTVRVNGTTLPSANPAPPGFTISSPSSLASGQSITITFDVFVNTIPNPNPIVNTARTSYNIVPIAGGSTINQTILSNNVNTTVNNIYLRSSKTRDRAFVTIGDIITYTIPITSVGNTTATNVIFKDTIPNGTALVPNSFVVNNATISSANPQSGVNIGDIGSGTVTTVSFQVSVTSVPNPNPIPNSATTTYSYTVDPLVPITSTSSTNTNIVTSQYNNATITSTKIVSKAYANIGDTLVYSIGLKNTGNVTATNILFIDTIPNDTTLVPSTFKQDTTNIGGSPNPPGVNLPNSIAPGITSTITFSVTVNTIPNPNPIPNNATASYSYTVDPVTPRTSTDTSVTNTVNTQVSNANLNGIVKGVDKLFATCGDIITYTITIPNTGNTTATNVIFKDTIPNGTVFVPDSVTVNGQSQPSGTNPQTGVSVGTISAGSSSVVKFQIKVNC